MGEFRWETNDCFSCGETGHQVKDCPKEDPRRMTAPLNRPPNRPLNQTKGNGRVFNLVNVDDSEIVGNVQGRESSGVNQDNFQGRGKGVL